MTDDAIIELWASMKPFMNKNDAITAADAFVATLDEHGLLDFTEHSVLSIECHLLKDAIISYCEFEFENEDGDEYE